MVLRLAVAKSEGGVSDQLRIGPAFAIPLGLWIAIAAVGGAAILIGCLWLTVRFRGNGWRARFRVTSGVCIVATMLLLVFAVAIPWIIHLARPYYLVFSPPPAAHATKSTTVAVTSVGLLAVLGGWIAAVRRLVSSSNALEKEVLSTAESGVKKYRSFFINLAATIAGPLLVLAGIVIATYWGSAYLPGFSGAGLVEFGVWLMIVLVWLFIWNFADVTAWSCIRCTEIAFRPGSSFAVSNELLKIRPLRPPSTTLISMLMSDPMGSSIGFLSLSPPAFQKSSSVRRPISVTTEQLLRALTYQASLSHRSRSVDRSSELSPRRYTRSSWAEVSPDHRPVSLHCRRRWPFRPPRSHRQWVA